MIDNEKIIKKDCLTIKAKDTITVTLIKDNIKIIIQANTIQTIEIKEMIEIIDTITQTDLTITILVLKNNNIFYGMQFKKMITKIKKLNQLIIFYSKLNKNLQILKKLIIDIKIRIRYEYFDIYLLINL